MHIQALLNLISLNITVPDLLAGESGTIIISLEGSFDPNIYIEFGDGRIHDSEKNSSGLVYETISSRPHPSVEIAVTHQYATAGKYHLFVNASNAISYLAQSAVVIVEKPITGVELTLLTSPLVALFEEVVVKATVKTGTDLSFLWDFGDETGGQYTMVNSHNNISIAHHSYGIADKYTVSVKVSNHLHKEPLTAYLETRIQAVEPIEQLHLRPIAGKYAAPLLETESKDRLDASQNATTKVIMFEARVWRGSDVDFIFDFGDEQEELVPAVLDMWSVPRGLAKHVYVNEGVYNVSVMARNPLGSVKQTLGRPFFVQFSPQGLSLDQPYYIVPQGNALYLHANIIRGTNVSFDWLVGENTHLSDAGQTVTVPFMRAGTYIVTVEAYNKVTDLAYEVPMRPSVSSKVYVQEPLKGIELCIKSNKHKTCTGEELDLPSEEEIEFEAKVVPSTEVALRFIWQLGIPELRRTNSPILKHRYRDPGRYTVNITAQNHISSISSKPIQLHLIQKIGNLTAIRYHGSNLVNHPITFLALYWFGTNLSFEWHFGDGFAPFRTHSASVQHTYTKVGEYWVTVYVWNKFSKENITTNIFFLNQPCPKPEISFLDQSRDRVIQFSDDVLLEADIFTSCDITVSTIYNWTVWKTDGGNTVEAIPSDRQQQRQLLLPGGLFSPGLYTVQLKVQMLGTIVYATVKTSLRVNLPVPIATIRGGFFRWVGQNDTINMSVDVNTEGYTSNVSFSFSWSCFGMIKKHISCFSEDLPIAFSNPSLSNFSFSTSSLDQRLKAVIFNVTIIGEKDVISSQVLEMTDKPHSLVISIECDECKDHQCNQHTKLFFTATCENCASHDVEYKWEVWLVQDGKHNLHFSNYECVQADGSTFFIIAPNSTLATVVNSTAISWSHALFEAQVGGQEFGRATYFPDDELPPFPSLPGFPEEEDQNKDPKRQRQVRDSPMIVEDTTLQTSLFSQLPSEGEALYESNFSFPDSFSLQEFFPMPPEPYPHFLLPGPDYPVTEEGLPGEGGSAAARDQSLQRLGISLTENAHEDRILEGAGKGRGGVSSGHPDIYPPIESNDPYNQRKGDTVRDSRLPSRPPIPHLANRPRLLVPLDPADTTTGLNLQHLALKPGVLRVGSTYFVQVTATRSSHPTMKGSAMDYVKVNIGPMNGRCTLMPTRGFALNTMFRLYCLEWQSEHSPLFYELSYSLNPEDPSHLIYFGLNRNVKFVLPAGLSENNFNVYLNVIVRDNLGAATKVCSIVREVFPLNLNTSVEHYVFNATFNPKSSLSKMLGEKQNQAILQRIQVWASSLSSHTSQSEHRVKKRHSSAEEIGRSSKICHRFLEIIDNLVFFSKAEAVQTLSALTAVISVPTEIDSKHLKTSWKIFLKFYATKPQLCGSCPSENLTKELITFLGKFVYITNAVAAIGDHQMFEIQGTSRSILHTEIKEILKKKHINEDPCLIEVPHLSVFAGYVTNGISEKTPLTISMKHSTIILPCCLNTLAWQIFGMYNDSNERCNGKYCQSAVNCIAVIFEEYGEGVLFDYPHHMSANTKPPYSIGQRISLSFHTCSTYEDLMLEVLPQHHPITVHFQRNKDVIEHNQTLLLWKKDMNVHVVNITQENVNQSLQLYLELIPTKEGKREFPLEIILSYQDHPTLNNYLMRSRSENENDVIHFFVPESMVKESGLYYVAVVDAEYNRGYPYKDVSDKRRYNFHAWRQQCFQRVGDIWSPKGCSVLPTSNHKFVHCRCKSLLGIASYSSAIPTDILILSAEQLSEINFNPISVIFLILLLLLYITLLIPIYYTDKKKNVKIMTISLKDNNVDHKQKYLLTVETGSFKNAGTTSSIYLILHGQRGMTETRQLIGHDHLEPIFQRGSVDNFLLSTSRSLGPLIKLEIWHNNCGTSPSWYLKTIKVKDLIAGSEYYFECYCWLSVEEEDGQIEREIAVAEIPPSFCKILREKLITSFNDIHLWSSLQCHSLSSSFTGVQRLSCCLSIILNSAAVIAIWYNYIISEYEELVILNFSIQTAYTGCGVALLVSVPEHIVSVLFRFSRPPEVKLPSNFYNLFMLWSWDSLYCWLRQKYSSHSGMTSESPSSVLDSSESMYSSGSQSSIPISEISEDSEDEKGEVADSDLSSIYFGEAVSPLEKTLSTWHAFEKWAKQRHGEIWNSDMVFSERYSFLEQDPDKEQLLIQKAEFPSYQKQTVVPNNETMDCKTIKDFAHTNNSVSCLSTTNNSHRDESGFEDFGDGDLTRLEGLHPDVNVSRSSCIKPQEQNSVMHSMALSPCCYYFSWGLLFIGFLCSAYFIIAVAARFETQQSIYWLQTLLISILCSCFVIHPCLASVVALISAIRLWIQLRQLKLYTPSEVDTDKQACDEDCKQDEYKGRTCLLNYLRPPQETVLIEARRNALREKYILAFLSGTTSKLVIFILLFVVAFSNHNYSHYYQKNSIQNAFIRSAYYPLAKIETMTDWWNWIQLDFLDSFYGDKDCTNDHHDNKECGVMSLTNSYPIGQTVLRKFQVTPQKCAETFKHISLHKCAPSYSLKFSSFEAELFNESKSYTQQRNAIWGLHGFYQFQDELILLNNSRPEVIAQLNYMKSAGWINRYTRAISVEFLLFNPTFSTFISVSLLVEFTASGGVSLFPLIVPFQLYHHITNWDYFSLVCELIFMLMVLMNIKKELWRMLKLKKCYWNCSWNCLKVLFLLVSIFYCICYICQFIAVSSVIQHLKETHLEINFDLSGVAYWNTVIQSLVGVLLFLHLIGCLQLLHYSPILFSFVQTIANCWKQLTICGVVCLFLIFDCGYLGYLLLGHNSNRISPYPLLQCMKAINLLLRDYKKPEITENYNTLAMLLSIGFLFMVLWITFCIMAMVRAVLINSRKCIQKKQVEKVTLREAGHVIQKKFLHIFQSPPPNIFIRDESALPMEFLLLELETMADKLVARANSLFAECDFVNLPDFEDEISNADSNGIVHENDLDEISIKDLYLTNSKIVTSDMLEMSHTKSLSSSYSRGSCESSCEPQSLSSSSSFDYDLHPTNKEPEKEDDIFNHRLPVTLPRESSRSRANNCSKVSFMTSSLSSQRQSKPLDSKSFSLKHQRGRIRKTHHMHPVGSTSSSSSDQAQLQREKGDANNGLTIRKTKSRGKGKNQDLNLDVLDDSSV